MSGPAQFALADIASYVAVLAHVGPVALAVITSANINFLRKPPPGDLLATATSEDSHHHALGRQLVRGEWSDISGEGVHTLRMVEKYHLFEWRAYPLFSLAHDIVTAPETLRERVEDYLKMLRETVSCAI